MSAASSVPQPPDGSTLCFPHFPTTQPVYFTGEKSAARDVSRLRGVLSFAAPPVYFSGRMHKTSNLLGWVCLFAVQRLAPLTRTGAFLSPGRRPRAWLCVSLPTMTTTFATIPLPKQKQWQRNEKGKRCKFSRVILCFYFCRTADRAGGVLKVFF